MPRDFGDDDFGDQSLNERYGRSSYDDRDDPYYSRNQDSRGDRSERRRDRTQDRRSRRSPAREEYQSSHKGKGKERSSRESPETLHFISGYMDDPQRYQLARSDKDRELSPAQGSGRSDTAEAQVFWGTGRNEDVTGGNRKAQSDLRGERVSTRDFGSPNSYLHSSSSSYGRFREPKDKERRRPQKRVRCVDSPVAGNSGLGLELANIDTGKDV